MGKVNEIIPVKRPVILVSEYRPSYQDSSHVLELHARVMENASEREHAYSGVHAAYPVNISSDNQHDGFRWPHAADDYHGGLGVTFRAYRSDYGENGISSYRTELAYNDTVYPGLTLARAARVYATLKRLALALTKTTERFGPSSSFGQDVARLADATQADTVFITRERSEYGGAKYGTVAPIPTRYADAIYTTDKPGDAAEQIDAVITRRLDAAVPVAVAVTA